MLKVLSLFVLLLASSNAIPLDHSSDDSVLSTMNLSQLASIMMTSSLESGSQDSDQKTTSDEPKSVHSSHLIEVSKDVSKGALLLPIETMVESGAVGGAIPAAAAIAGSVKGSAIATPIIVKAVALPGIAAGATAAFMSVPKLLVEGVPQLMFHNVKTSVEDSAHNFANLFIVEDFKRPESEALVDEENHTTLDLNQGIENVANTVEAVKAGALGLATKGLVVAKKGAVVAGRIILKPIAILTGVHLKMLGSGLTLGGKLIGGTGAGIAKAGTVVKYAGLGSIGLGASAIGWGLDKSTIDTHFTQESHLKLN